MSEFNLKLDYYGLLNLHKALLEAKFNMNPDNEMVSGTPFVANIYAEVRDMLIESDNSGQWQEWFQLRHRPDYRQRAIMRMKKTEGGTRHLLREGGRLQNTIWSHFFIMKQNWTK